MGSIEPPRCVLLLPVAQTKRVVRLRRALATMPRAEAFFDRGRRAGRV